jgi:uncharacterized protein (DUF58 family)
MEVGPYSQRDETLVKRRPWYLLAAILLLLSIITRQPIAFLAAIFILVLALVPEIWYRYALRDLLVQHQLNQKRAFFGDTITLSLRIENQKLLPLPWLEIEDEMPMQLPLLTGKATTSFKPNRVELASSCSLWAFQRLTRRYRIKCSGRGVYTFGPALVRSGDPFGWLACEERVDARASILVYPLVAPIEAFGLPPRHPFGERVTPRRLLEDPLRVAGVRDYVLGDDPRRIHWKATARAGELRSKIYEPSSQHRLLILLDINTYAEPWMGLDADIQELTISAAASLAMWALDEGYSVGLLANSLMMGLAGEDATASETERSPKTLLDAQMFVHRVRVPLASDEEQGERILSALGRLLSYFGSPIDALIDSERSNLPIGTTVVLVSAAAALHDTTVESLIDMRSHGATVQLLMAGDEESKAGAETYDLPVYHIGGREVWHELTQQIADERESAAGQSSSVSVPVLNILNLA